MIVLGLCTYKRREFLLECLNSLKKLKMPLDIKIKIVIVDNDINKSAYDIVKKFSQDIPIPVEYEVETNKGIPFARNRVLRIAIQLRAIL